MGLKAEQSAEGSVLNQLTTPPPACLRDGLALWRSGELGGGIADWAAKLERITAYGTLKLKQATVGLGSGEDPVSDSEVR
jgi:hypothetical protein